jgi:hypothetical protein
MVAPVFDLSDKVLTLSKTNFSPTLVALVINLSAKLFDLCIHVFLQEVVAHGDDAHAQQNVNKVDHQLQLIQRFSRILKSSQKYNIIYFIGK